VLDGEPEPALPGADGAALAFARRWLGEARVLRDRVSCASLIERVLDRSGYAAGLLHQEGGDVALANLRKLVGMADGRPEASLAGFVSWLRDRGASSAREAEAALHTAGEDVVTLTTVHGAKGLEWPVVFLCDLDREPAGDAHAPVLYLDAADGIGVRSEGRVRAEGRAGLRRVRVSARAGPRARDGGREARLVRGQHPCPRPARPVRPPARGIGRRGRRGGEGRRSRRHVG
jgi:hypothetical protein